MAGGRGIIGSDGKLLIRSDGTVDVCEDCCGPYRKLFKCDDSGSSFYVRSSNADEGDGVIYGGVRYNAGAETTLGGTLLDAGDITVQDASDSYTATFAGVNANPCTDCSVIAFDGSYELAETPSNCLYQFLDATPNYGTCTRYALGPVGVDVRLSLHPSDGSIKQVIANAYGEPTARFFNTGLLASGLYFVGDSIPSVLAADCTFAIAYGGTATVAFT